MCFNSSICYGRIYAIITCSNCELHEMISLDSEWFILITVVRQSRSKHLVHKYHVDIIAHIYLESVKEILSKKWMSTVIHKVFCITDAISMLIQLSRICSLQQFLIEAVQPQPKKFFGQS